jgi:alginate O-acetyltransferase complex protein AlgI
MAIGIGRLLGFRFLENFRTPYAAASVQDFWRRWHISLSTWYRDYLYIPLGGSRGSETRTYLNLVAVFALCGLWHGASWLFVLWGLWHGLFLVLERAGLGALLARLPRPAGHAYALAVVLVGWVLFRSADLGQAWDLLAAMAGGGAAAPAPAEPLDSLHLLALIACPLFALPVAARVRALLGDRGDPALRAWCAASLAGPRLLGLALVLAYCLAQVARQSYNPFIYFRF